LGVASEKVDQDDRGGLAIYISNLAVKFHKNHPKNSRTPTLNLQQFTAIKIQEPQFEIFSSQKMSKAMDIILILFL